MKGVAPLGVAVLLGTLFLLLPGVETTVPARAAQTTCPTPVTIANGDFEAPVIAANSMSLIAEGPDMPGWKTTAPDKVFELWREVRQTFTSASGNQFVELNANYVSQLYQDLPTTPGQTLRWELRHRGRLGTDVMATKIGPPGGTLVQQGTLISDGAAAWGTWSGIYTVPAGQTVSRFAFDSISAAQNKPTYGNFLDGISFGNAPCLVSTASVSAGSGNVGDVLTYTVNASNQGGNPAKNVIFADDLPAGVTFVPGSIKTITGSSSTTVSDAADSDTGEYDAASRTVRVRAGTGSGASSGGQIPVGESRSFSYQVRVTSAAAASTISNEAAVSYLDALTSTTVTSTSSTAGTTVAAAADLAITAAVVAPGTIAGSPAGTVLTVVNKGPNTANTVQVSSVIPFGIVGIGATSPQGTCNVSGYLATCDIPSLAAGATATMNITGTVIPQATPGAQATLTASATSATYEISQADNATSVSSTVATHTDLRVVQAYTPAVPVAGTTVTYTATVTNNGPSTARDITLTDPIATGSTFISATPSAGTCALAAATRTVECTLPTTDPGVPRTVTIVVQLDSNGTGAVNNAVSVSSSTPETNIADNNYSVQSAGTAEADVGVQLTIGATSAKPGDTVPFTLTVTNNGPSAATNVSFNTVVPVGFTINRPASPYCTTTACTFPALPATAVVRIAGTVTIGANAASGSQRASTTVISPTTDPSPANDTSVVLFTIELEADLTVSQVITNETDTTQPLIAGHDVKGVVTVGNDGPTRAEGVVLRQAIPAGRPIPVASQSGGTCAFQGSGTPGTVTADGGIYVCTRPSLATSASWQIEFAGVPLSASYSAPVYSRTATVSATNTDPDGSDNSVTTTRTVERRSNLRVTKSVSPGSVVQSDQLTFTIRVRNYGPSDAAGVMVREEADAGLVLLTGTPSSGSYDSGASIWSIPQVTAGAAAEDLLLTASAQGSGSLTNSSQIIASGSTDPDTSDNADSATVTVAAAAPVLKLEVLTTLAPSSAVGAAAGTTISYQYKITNTGNLTMSSLSVSGTRGGIGNCGGVTSLVPAADVTCTAASTYLVTSADITAGNPISDTATAKAQAPINIEPIAYAQTTASVPVVVAVPSLTAVVTATVSTVSRQNAAAAGDRIDYAYAVTNNGNVSMDSIAVTDTRVTPVSCPQTTLAIGASMTCTIAAANRYTVTPADLDTGGAITSSATITGVPAGTSTVKTYGPYSASVTVAIPAPALAVVVTPASAATVAVGDTIGYTYVVTNNGNVTLGNLAVSDSKVSGVTCPASVAAGATVPCQSVAPYVVTQDDVDAEQPVVNDAIIAGTSVAPGAAVATAEGGSSVAVVGSTPLLTLAVTTSVSPAVHQSGVTLGDLVDSRYRVRNTGNVTMAGITVTDTLGGTASCPAGTLAVGAIMDCDAATYTVRQTDVDTGGTLTGAAQLRGRSPQQSAASLQATEGITVPIAPGALRLTLTGQAVVTPGDHRNGVGEGDTIGYEYTVSNPGTLTMRDVIVEDSRFAAASCTHDTLAPGDAMTCRSLASYTVTADDVAAGGEVRNRATVSGRGGGQGRTFGPVEVGVPILVSWPELMVHTTAVVTPAANQDAAEFGDTITYTHEVINSGNQPVTGIAVTTTRTGPIRCPQTTLAVRASMTCVSGVYRVTQGDIDAATAIVDEVAVVGYSPGKKSFGPFKVSVGVADPLPALRLRMWASITASASEAGDVAVLAATSADIGDTVRYRYQVTNAGNVTVRSLTVTDSRAGSVTCADTRLSVGVSTTCTADRAYRVTQDDIDNSRPVAARATAAGLWSTTDRGVGSNSAETTVPVAAARPKLIADQKATWTDVDGDGKLGVPDDVVSTVAVRNEGNVTLVNVRVTGLPAKVTCPATRLAPGGTVTCRSDVYHLTEREAASGRHTYEVLVTGDRTAAAADPVEATAPSTVVVPSEDPQAGPDHPPGTVPVTGGSAAMFLAGFAMILTGVALLLVTRRSRPSFRVS
ncbi:putative repeat protein (TIGR01451 family) [Actinoplanes lutulentus]|uniref:Putative repeat protein (TIGR01451 family) n=1 Tax=Actinoplanes lutulentus TaxID=1287878 RepID=A0A327ZLS5_9ACTN|nr:NEW3 domain-containing protein [Actinoplanes lutulentus]MBB2940992.1 putative repeat protein (TIGR01451 family) [Actinoplanes lutulentus]RAK43301.1 putative repeat protein (TIGR01451 family) [Actinoplanes lutulentus]